MFTAPVWCGPCQRFEPHWNAASERAEGTLFLKVDMGETPDLVVDHWATKRFHILGVPTVKYWDNDVFIMDEPTTIKARTTVALLKAIGHG